MLTTPISGCVDSSAKQAAFNQSDSEVCTICVYTLHQRFLLSCRACLAVARRAAPALSAAELAPSIGCLEHRHCCLAICGIQLGDPAQVKLAIADGKGIGADDTQRTFEDDSLSLCKVGRLRCGLLRPCAKNKQRYDCYQNETTDHRHCNAPKIAVVGAFFLGHPGLCRVHPSLATIRLRAAKPNAMSTSLRTASGRGGLSGCSAAHASIRAT